QVFWSDRTRIYRCPATGCDSMPSQYSVGRPSSSLILLVAVDNSGFYWSEAGTNYLKKCPLCGCGGTVVVASESRPGQYLTTDDTNVYWQSNQGQMPAELHTCTADSCAQSTRKFSSYGSGHDLLKHGPYAYLFISQFPYDTLVRLPPLSS